MYNVQYMYIYIYIYIIMYMLICGTPRVSFSIFLPVTRIDFKTLGYLTEHASEMCKSKSWRMFKCNAGDIGLRSIPAWVAA